jgi:excisionase family DNA binding protein
MLTITEAAEFLGVSKPTIRRWDKAGKLPSLRTAGNHRRYPKQWLLALLNKDPIPQLEEVFADRKNLEERKPAIYARVSVYHQKRDGNLDRQIDRIKEHAKLKGEPLEHTAIISENGSGLNTDRRGLDKLLKMVEKQQISTIYIEYPDRLTRFGFRYLERYCAGYGTAISSVSDKISKSPEEELSNDIMSLLACFSGRLYSKRRGGKANVSESDLIEKSISEYISDSIDQTIEGILAE